MADVPGRSVAVFADGFDMTANYQAFDLEITRMNDENTVFGNASQNFIYTGGIGGTLTLDGFYDTEAGQDDAVWQILTGGDNNIMVIPEGNTEGNVGYALNALEAKRTITAQVQSVVAATIDFTATGGIHKVNLMHALGARTSTATGTVLNNTESSLDGGVAYVMLTEHAGNYGSFDLKIEDSPNNSSWATLATFTQITADNAHEQITFTGTVDQYLRLSWTLTTITSATFVCGVHRNNPI